MKKISIALLALTFAAVGCGAAEDFDETDSVELAAKPPKDAGGGSGGSGGSGGGSTCPVTLNCMSNQPPGFTLVGTDYCIDSGTLKCWWGNYQSGGSGLTTLQAPEGCRYCVPASGGGPGTCGVTDPPVTWSCTAS